MPSRLFGSRRPAKDHMTRGGGYAGEIRDLRRDTEATFLTLESGGMDLSDGFALNLLPTLNDRSTILAAGNSILSIPLDQTTWYSISVEIIVKNPTQSHFYIYRNLIEAYRDGGVAVLHSGTAGVFEEPTGGFTFYTVGVTVSGSDVRVQLNNGSANTINFARYAGYSRKPIP